MTQELQNQLAYSSCTKLDSTAGKRRPSLTGAWSHHKQHDWERRLEGFHDILETESNKKQKYVLPDIEDSSSSEEEERRNTSAGVKESKVSKNNTCVIRTASGHTSLKKGSFNLSQDSSASLSIDEFQSTSSQTRIKNSEKKNIPLVNLEAETPLIAEYCSDIEEDVAVQFEVDENEAVSDTSLSPVISVARSLSPGPSSKDSFLPCNKSKASDWVRSVQWQKISPEKDEQSELPYEDSAKKKKPKYLRNGLAEKLHQLILHEKSTSAFWRHKQSRNIEALEEKSDSKTVSLRIGTHSRGPSLIIASADILSDGGNTESFSSHAQINVMFSESVWTEKCLKFGTQVKIYPPWQTLKKGSGELTLLCTNHCQVLPDDNAHPYSCSSQNANKGQSATNILATWFCACSEDPTCLPQDCPADKNPVDMSDLIPASSIALPSRKTTTLQSVAANEDQIPEEGPHSFLSSIEGTGKYCCDQLSFTATIQRIFRKRFLHTKGKEVNDNSTVSEQEHVTVSLLLQDFCGFFCEMELPETVHDKKSHWQEVLDGEGKTFEWHNITCLQRQTEDRTPKLFGMIRSLWKPEAVLEKPDVMSQDMSQECSNLTHPPTFCYMLQAPSGADRCFVQQPKYDALPIYSSRTYNSLRDVVDVGERTVAERVNIKAKVAFVQTHSDTGNPPASSTFTLHLCDQSQTLHCVKVFGSELSYHKNWPWSSSHWYTFCDVMREKDDLILDEYSSVHVHEQNHTGSVLSDLPLLHPAAKIGHIYRLTGVIDSIEESTAYTWMVCPNCETDNLKGGTASRPFVFCPQCQRGIANPEKRMNLEVYLNGVDDFCQVRIKLLQGTIEKLLPDEVDEEGYDVQCILRKSLKAIAVIVTSVSKASIRGKPDVKLQQIHCLC